MDHCISARLQASEAVLLLPTLFWDVTQRRLAVGTDAGYPETSVSSCHSMPPHIPKERSLWYHSPALLRLNVTGFDLPQYVLFRSAISILGDLKTR